MQKFKAGDRVRIVKYGHLIFSFEKGEEKAIDIRPEYVGKEATVVGSYFDLYRKGYSKEDPNMERDRKQYHLDGILGKEAWWNEGQLELIEELKTM